jgi:hypothetical protein
MREAYDRTGDTDTAVFEDVGRTGRLVTSAALILGLAFVAFSATPGTEVKMFATALGGGILIDTTIIRGILGPRRRRVEANRGGRHRGRPFRLDALSPRAGSPIEAPLANAPPTHGAEARRRGPKSIRP